MRVIERASDTVINKIQSSFINFGWLMPAFFPLAMIGGRGLFNSAFYFYVLWALLTAPLLRHKCSRSFTVAVGLLLAAYLPSIIFAVDPARTLKIWITVLLFSSVAPITLVVLSLHPEKLDDLMRALGLAALAAVAACYADLAGLGLFADSFVPRLDLRAVDLPFYLPFLLAWLGSTLRPNWKRPAIAGALIALSAFVVISDERGSLIGLVAALLVMGALVFDLSPARLIAAVLACIAFALLLNGDGILRGLSGEGDWLTRLDAFSSWRITLWSQALENPPTNIWFGVGMGNTEHYPDVITIKGHVVRHLHNLWLDAWYETGLLGLTALVGLILTGFARIARAWRELDTKSRQIAGLVLTAAIALIAQAQFSISYASREFNIYFLLCLALLFHLEARSGEGRLAQSIDDPRK